MALDLAPAIALLRRDIPGFAGAYLFGSAADGTDGPESDVDIAVFAGRSQLDRARVLDVQEALAKVIGRDVDLIDLAAAPTILQAQVIGEGRLIDAPDADAIAFFEVRILREYQQLKARRAGIEADIRERGRIYAR
ncbi:MAG TPA: nucleotidyltransferase domain-containing protein [Terricaulis sp.]|nr:nucleotidyltransferase domain-containing protein [Terricaulis sp.]